MGSGVDYDEVPDALRRYYLTINSQATMRDEFKIKKVRAKDFDNDGADEYITWYQYSGRKSSRYDLLSNPAKLGVHDIMTGKKYGCDYTFELSKRDCAPDVTARRDYAAFK